VPQDNPANPRGAVPQGKITVLLAVAAMLLVAMHPASRFIGEAAHWWFDLDGEGNIPALFSTALLAAVSLTAFSVHRARDRKTGRSRLARFFWLWFSVFYAFLAVDEGFEVHESIGRFVHLKWIYVYLPFVAAAFGVILYYFGKLRKEDRLLGRWVVGGLVVFAYGGLICEFISHRCSPLPFALQETEFMVEEGLEMLGTIMVLRGCMGELNRVRQTRRDLF
jgi:hypothetical protein